jgi:hypothetical protein
MLAIGSKLLAHGLKQQKQMCLGTLNLRVGTKLEVYGLKLKLVGKN